MNNYSRGHTAEITAAEHLKQNGFKILKLNWKTSLCEIDIVASKDKCIYFVEVKSRKTAYQGSGLDYVTPKKLKQMKYAADTWCSANKWHGRCRLAAIGITEGKILYTDEIWL